MCTNTRTNVRKKSGQTDGTMLYYEKQEQLFIIKYYEKQEQLFIIMYYSSFVHEQFLVKGEDALGRISGE